MTKKEQTRALELLKNLVIVFEEECRWGRLGYCEAHLLDHTLDGCRVAEANKFIKDNEK